MNSNRTILEALINRFTRTNKDRIISSYPLLHAIHGYNVTISAARMKILKQYANVHYHPELGMISLYYK